MLPNILGHLLQYIGYDHYLLTYNVLVHFLDNQVHLKLSKQGLVLHFHLVIDMF